MITIKIYVEHGYYKYSVDSVDTAMEHAHTIAKSGIYRRQSSEKSIELYKVLKVKVVGVDGLLIENTDTFHIT